MPTSLPAQPYPPGHAKKNHARSTLPNKLRLHFFSKNLDNVEYSDISYNSPKLVSPIQGNVTSIHPTSVGWMQMSACRGPAGPPWCGPHITGGRGWVVMMMIPRWLERRGTWLLRINEWRWKNWKFIDEQWDVHNNCRRLRVHGFRGECHEMVKKHRNNRGNWLQGTNNAYMIPTHNWRYYYFVVVVDVRWCCRIQSGKLALFSSPPWYCQPTSKFEVTNCATPWIYINLRLSGI